MALFRTILVVLDVAALAAVVPPAGVVLIQTQARLQARNGSNNTDVPNLMGKMVELDAEAKALEQTLTEMQSSGDDELEALTISHRKHLDELQGELRAIEKSNLRTARNIRQERSHLQMLRMQAAEVSSSNDALLTKIHILENNLTTSITFSKDTFVQAASARQPAETALGELAELASDETPKSEKVVLLQTSGIEDTARKLSVSLDAAVVDNENHIAKINATYEQQVTDLDARREELVRKRSELEAKQGELGALVNRTKVALQYLKTVHMMMEQQYDALRQHLLKIAAPPSSTVSLLQLSASSPDTADLAEAASSVDQSLGSVERSLQAMRQRQNNETKALKAECAEKLHKQAKQIQAQAKVNEVLAEAVYELDLSITTLRGKANVMLSVNAKLKEDIGRLRKNMSMASEFIDVSINSSNDYLASVVSDLSILQELDDEDLKQNQAAIHSDRLVAVAKAALLQTDVVGGQGPKGAIDVFNASLQDMDMKHNRSLASIQASFEEAFKAGEDRLAALVREELEMNATVAPKEAIEKKLEQALSVLSDKQASLKSAKASLLAYIKRVGGSSALNPDEKPKKQPLALLSERISTSADKVTPVLSKLKSFFLERA